MKQQELFSYVYDFLSSLLDHEEILASVRRIILFGSAVRGDFHAHSDIDLFIDTISAHKIEKTVQKEQALFEKRIGKTWELRGITLPLKVQIGDLEHPRWEALSEQIAQYGKIVYGPYEQAPKDLQHYTLMTYDLSALSQKRKMGFIRTTYGYKSKKGKVEYTKKGLLEELGGRRIGTNSLLVPRDKVRKIRLIFNTYRLTPTVKDVWLSGIVRAIYNRTNKLPSISRKHK